MIAAALAKQATLTSQAAMSCQATATHVRKARSSWRMNLGRRNSRPKFCLRYSTIRKICQRLLPDTT